MIVKALRVLASFAFLLSTSLASADTPKERTISDLVIREIAVPGLPDTAMAEMTLAGPVILYNPELFRAAGPAREFVRAHERGHVVLSHLDDPWMIETDAGRAEAEAQADCFAARTAAPLSVIAMTRLLLRRAPEASDSIYGTKRERVRRILRCAGISQS